MASSFRKPQHLVATLLFLAIITASSSLSSARLLNDFMSDGQPATQTTSDLAVSDVVFEATEHDPKPCDHHVVPMKRSHVQILRSPTQRLAAGKYEAMILGRLPKGAPLPPSAPSRGTNNVNN
ncbi:hypothetical protein V6N13_131059 [Hibiscus sabdariffa]|uniref:Uncharacterized protein n=1 Tax=Hibiscus sabdariffa TaxID=183260 RepID=A0ABR2D7L9_9ROSI